MIDALTRSVGATQLCTIEPGSADFRRWIDIAADAYPVLRLDAAARDAAFERERDRGLREGLRTVGAYRDGRLVGGMRVYDFSMCVRGAQMFTGGLGSVAVGLEHRQAGIARDLVAGFITEYRERGAALAALYAFRPTFYHKLGFGYGSKMQQYRFTLDALPQRGFRDRVRRLSTADLDAFLDVYERVAQRTNGLIRRDRRTAEHRLTEAAHQTYGYFSSNGLGGYLIVEVKLERSGRQNRNELFVHELIYETPEALAALLAFVRSWSDQYAALIVSTQDPDFHFVPSDPRNGSDRSLYPPAYHETNSAGIGIMYRVIDVAAFVRAAADCEFGELDATVRIDLADAFVGENSRAYAIRFEAGRPRLLPAATGADVDLAIDVADFSALLMGSVRLRSLVAYGRAVLSKPDWLRRLDAAFDTSPPQCLTRF